MIIDCVNLVTQLYLTYLMLLFTDFTTYKIQEDSGNQFLYAVLVNIVVNLSVALIPQIVYAYMCYKRWRYFRKVHKIIKKC